MDFPFPVLSLDAASAYERGLCHGTEARGQIQISIDTYRRFFKEFVDVGWEEAQRLGEGFGEAIARIDEDLFDELRGIAQGSGLRLSEILALNARSEIGLGPAMLDGCTAIAAFGSATSDGRGLLCQNWDWRRSQRGAFLALRIERPGKPRITMLTEAGIIGKIGFNDEGLGVCLNAVVTDEMRRDGTPLHIVLRGILEARTLGEAIEKVARAQIASAANFLVCQDGAGAVDIEAVPSGVGVLLPEDDTLIHTNHLLSARLTYVNDLAASVFGDSFPRLATARRVISERRGALNAAGLAEVLRNHENIPDSICRHEDVIGDVEGKRLESVFSVIMDLRARELAVTDGPPCSAEYVSIDAAAGVGAAVQ